MPRRTLSRSMTLDEFDTGYWYALALKRFAKELGIGGSSWMRKDELEAAIRSHLVTGKHAPVEARRVPAGVPKDVERGLRLDLPIRRYTNDARDQDVHRNPGAQALAGAQAAIRRTVSPEPLARAANERRARRSPTGISCASTSGCAGRRSASTAPRTAGTTSTSLLTFCAANRCFPHRGHPRVARTEAPGNCRSLYAAWKKATEGMSR